MRTASQGLKDHLAAGNAFLIADLVTLTVGATAYRWTIADTSITYGGNTYVATGPTIELGTARLTSVLEVDTFDVDLGAGSVTIGSKGLALAAVDGALDGAPFTVDRVYMPTWGDTSLGTRRIFTGSVAAVEPSSTSVRITVKSSLEKLNAKLPKRKIQPGCPLALYSTECGASAVTHTTTTTIAAGSTRQIVNVASAPAGITSDWWIEVTSGAASGARRQVASASGTALTLDVQLPALPATGDGIQIVRGCNKTRSTCLNTFSRLAGFRGFPDVPTKEA